MNAIDDALYQKSLLPLKDGSGKEIPLPSIFGANTLGLLPTINFGLPSGFSAQSAGQGITNVPTFGHDPRWPFLGTDTVQSISDKVTWLKGSHNFKAGFYYERMARNVAVYETYQPQGIYYFGSDRASPVDTGYPYSNLLSGNFTQVIDFTEAAFTRLDEFGAFSLAWSEVASHTKLRLVEANRLQEASSPTARTTSARSTNARYNQEEWFVQDTWKLSRRVTLDYGARFFVVGPLYSVGATLGLFQGSAYSASKSGQLLYPAMVNGQKASVNLATGQTFSYVRQGTFDTGSYPAGGIPFSGIVQYPNSFFHTPPVQVGPRAGLAWDVFGNGRTALRAGFGIAYGRPWNVDMIGAAHYWFIWRQFLGEFGSIIFK